MNCERRARLRRLSITMIALAGAGTVGVPQATDDIQVFYGYYKDDQRLTVKSPSVIVNKDLREDTTVAIKYLHETFSKSAPDNSVDAVSGATTVAGGTGSGFKETRKEGSISGSHRFGDNEVAAGIIRSDESDFESSAFSLAYSREFFQKNLTITGLYGYTEDTIDKLDAAPEERFPKEKTTDAITLSATQLLSPTALISGGYSFADIQGHQSNPSRRVAVTRQVPGGSVQTIYDESHPNQRNRNTLFVRGTKYFLNRSSVDLNLALYDDSWGVNARTIEFRYYHYLTPRLLGRLRYRYYNQEQADFYQASYSEAETIMTADARLRAFDSQLAGAQLTYFPRAALKDLSFAASYDRYNETNNGLTADVYQLSIVIPY